MKGTAVQGMFDRVARAHAALKENPWREFAYSARSATGEEVRYSIRGIKSHQEYADLIANLCNWTWSLKDHLIHLFRSEKLDEQTVERAVNGCRELCILSDLRNREQHGGLRGSRSKLFAQVGPVRFEAPQESLQALIQEADGNYIFIFKQPELVEYYAPVLGQNGEDLGDAVAICSASLDAWQTLVRGHGLGHVLG